MVEIRSLRPLVKIQLPQRPERKRGYVRKGGVPIRVERRRVDHPPPTPLDTPCVLWQGALDGDGYGHRWAYYDDGSRAKVRVYRWVVEQMEGRRLHPDEVVLHACDNRLCFRYDHLSLGTVADNNRDAWRKGRLSPPPITLPKSLRGPTITGAQAGAVKRAYMNGISAESLARQYGVNISQIYKYTRGLPKRPPAASEATSPQKRTTKVKHHGG